MVNNFFHIFLSFTESIHSIAFIIFHTPPPWRGCYRWMNGNAMAVSRIASRGPQRVAAAAPVELWKMTRLRCVSFHCHRRRRRRTYALLLFDRHHLRAKCCCGLGAGGGEVVEIEWGLVGWWLACSGRSLVGREEFLKAVRVSLQQQLKQAGRHNALHS